MHICHFTSTFLPRVGGVEMVVSNLAASQITQGHQVTVITPHIRGVNNKVDVPYRVVHYLRPSSKRFFTRQVLIRLLWEHWKKPFDVLHCHSGYPHAYVGATFKKLTGVAVIVTPHGPTDIMSDERIRQDPRLGRRLAQGLLAADGITAISNHICDEILSVGDIPAWRVRVIPNGIRLSDYQNIVAYQHDHPYCLAIGRLVPQKGFDVLVRAFAKAADQLADLHLFVMGQGIQMTELQQLVTELGIAERVRFLGLKQGEEKTAYLHGATMFVCSSRVEPFGIVVIEAMAAGLPVIATQVGGIVDVLNEGETGMLVPPEDPQALAEALVALYHNPAMRQKFQSNVKTDVLQYDWDRITQQYMRFYEEVLSKRNMPVSI